MGKKSNKRTQPGDAESSLALPVSVAWAKTRWMQRCAWERCFDMVYSSRRCIDLDPLKQFAPVIHGNRKDQAASQWAKPSAGQSGSSSKAISTKKQKKGRAECSALPFFILI
jgi:hypothetical protein